MCVPGRQLWRRCSSAGRDEKHGKEKVIAKTVSAGVGWQGRTSDIEEVGGWALEISWMKKEVKKNTLAC